MKKKVGLTLLSGVIAVTMGTGVLAACGDNTSSDKGKYTLDMHGVYAYAEEHGYTGTYEDLIAAVKGDAGRGIDKIEKTGSNGKVDTYTVTYTDGTTSTFTLTNGENGQDGQNGEKGADGITPHIGADGYWYFGAEKTEYKATGDKGENGADGITPHIGADGYWYIGETKTEYKAVGTDGKSSYDLWLEKGNKGTEEEYLNSLVGKGIVSVSINDKGELVIEYTTGEKDYLSLLGNIAPSSENVTISYEIIDITNPDSTDTDAFDTKIEVVKGDRAVDLSVYEPAADDFNGLLNEWYSSYEVSGTWYYKDSKGALHEWLFEVYPVLSDMTLYYKLDGTMKSYSITYAGLEKSEELTRELGEPAKFPTSYKGEAMPTAPTYAAYKRYTDDETNKEMLKVFTGWEMSEDKGNITFTAQWKEVEYGFKSEGISINASGQLSVDTYYKGEDKVVIISGDDAKTTTTTAWFYQSGTNSNGTAVERVYIIADQLTGLNSSNMFKQSTSLQTVIIDAPALTTFSSSFEAQNASAVTKLKAVGFYTKVATLPANFVRYQKNLEVVDISDNITAWGNYVFENTGDFNIIENIGWDYLNKLTSIGSYAFGNNNTPWGELHIGTQHFANLASNASYIFGSPNATAPNTTITALYIETYATTYSMTSWNYYTALKHVEIYAPNLTSYAFSFQNCTGLESIYAYVPSVKDNPATNLGDDAQYTGYSSANSFASSANYLQNTQIKSIYVTDNVKYQGREGAVFVVGAIRNTGKIASGATNVREVVYDVDTLTTIPASAFASAPALEHIAIYAQADQLKYIGMNAFQNDAKLTSIILPATNIDYMVSVSYNSSTKVYTPSYNSFYTVFMGCNNLRNVTTLDRFATGLANRDGNAMVSFDAPVFKTYLNNGLYIINGTIVGVQGTVSGEITIPANVTAIGGYAFYGNKTITSVKLAANNKLELIGQQAFSLNTAGGYNEVLKSIDLSNATALKTIGNYAFNGCAALSEVKLPTNAANFTWIGAYAFQNTTALEKITIPKSVKYMVDTAYTPGGWNNSGSIFMGSGIKSVIFEDGIQLEYFASHMFNSATQMDSEGANAILKALAKALVVADGAKLTVPENIFYNVKSEAFTEITIPKEYKAIGEQAFRGAANLAKLTFEKGSLMEEFKGGSNFAETKIDEIIVPKNVTNFNLNMGSQLKSVKWEGGSKLETISSGFGSSNASSANQLMTTFQIPSTVTNISAGNFLRYTNIEKIEIVEWDEAAGEWKVIGTNTLPAHLTNISTSAFGNTQLKNFTIPSSVKFSTDGRYEHRIPNSMFQNCAKLEWIYIPDNIIEIDSNAFAGCTSLKKVELNSQYMKINSAAFDGCTSLEYFKAPADTDYSSSNIFRNCTKLATVILTKGASSNITRNVVSWSGNSNTGYTATYKETAFTTSNNNYTPWYQMMENLRTESIKQANLYIDAGVTGFSDNAFRYTTAITDAMKQNFHIYLKGADFTTKGTNANIYDSAQKHVNSGWIIDENGNPVVK